MSASATSKQEALQINSFTGSGTLTVTNIGTLRLRRSNRITSRAGGDAAGGAGDFAGGTIWWWRWWRWYGPVEGRQSGGQGVTLGGGMALVVAALMAQELSGGRMQLVHNA